MEFNEQQLIEYMNLALNQAKKAFMRGEVPVGAIIVSPEGKVVSMAYNKRILAKDATAHAEVLAIKKACKKIKDFRLENCVMFVTLMPCFMCAGAIINSRLKAVYYGAKSDRVDENLFLNILNNDKTNHKTLVFGGVCAKESEILLKEFFSKRRN